MTVRPSILQIDSRGEAAGEFLRLCASRQLVIPKDRFLESRRPTNPSPSGGRDSPPTSGTRPQPESNKPRLLDLVRRAIRALHYSRSIEKAYVAWIRRFILYHGKRHPAEMGTAEIAQFLPALATRRKRADRPPGPRRHAARGTGREVGTASGATRMPIHTYSVTLKQENECCRIQSFVLSGRPIGQEGADRVRRLLVFLRSRACVGFDEVGAQDLSNRR